MPPIDHYLLQMYLVCAPCDLTSLQGHKSKGSGISYVAQLRSPSGCSFVGHATCKSKSFLLLKYRHHVELLVYFSGEIPRN